MPGTRVFGLATGCLASHVVSHSNTLAALPGSLTFEVRRVPIVQLFDYPGPCVQSPGRKPVGRQRMEPERSNEIRVCCAYSLVYMQASVRTWRLAHVVHGTRHSLLMPHR